MSRSGYIDICIEDLLTNLFVGRKMMIERSRRMHLIITMALSRRAVITMMRLRRITWGWLVSLCRCVSPSRWIGGICMLIEILLAMMLWHCGLIGYPMICIMCWVCGCIGIDITGYWIRRRLWGIGRIHWWIGCCAGAYMRTGRIWLELLLLLLAIWRLCWERWIWCWMASILWHRCSSPTNSERHFGLIVIGGLLMWHSGTL